MISPIGEPVRTVNDHRIAHDERARMVAAAVRGSASPVVLAVVDRLRDEGLDVDAPGLLISAKDAAETRAALAQMGPLNGAHEPAEAPLPEPLDIFRTSIAPRLDPADFPRVIADYMMPLARAAGHDPGAYLMAGLGAAAAAASDSLRVMLDKRSSWFESPRLWIMLIGGPGTAKTPSMRAATTPIVALHKESRAEHAEAVAKAPEGEERPPAPSLFVNDATIEKLSEILAVNERGIVAIFEELDTWIGGHDCYRGGQGSKDRGEWLRLYDGGPHQVDRIKRGTFFVPNWGASILGATTPAGLRRHVRELPPDGLIQRFLPVIVRPMCAVNDAVTNEEIRKAKIAYEDALRAVYRDDAGHVNLSAEAASLFFRRRDELRDEVPAMAALSEQFAGHLAKHAGMLGRLALTIHTLDGRAEPSTITGETMAKADRLLRRLTRHAMVLFEMLAGEKGAAGLARKIALSILASGIKGEVSKNRLIQVCRPFRDADEAAQWSAITALEDAAWLLPGDGRIYRGRPTAWVVHPDIHDRFAKQAERHRELRRTVAGRIRGDAEMDDEA
jgi:hypothetical protein